MRRNCFRKDLSLQANSRRSWGKFEFFFFLCFLFFSNRRSQQGNGRVVILSQDSYYLGLTPEQNQEADDYNFDHPSAFDWELIEKHLAALKRKKPIEVPHYDFVTHQRTKETTHVYGADVVLFEGILAFSEPPVRELMDMKLFVDTDDDTRLIRRIRRDMAHRGRTLESILTQYERHVKPAFDNYILPTRKYADVIIPRGHSNKVAIALIVQHIQQELVQRTPAKGRGAGRSRVIE